MAGWVLLFIIIGFFVWGFLKKGSKNTSDREDFLHRSISEFESILRRSPGKTVKSLLEDYRHELDEEGGHAFGTAESADHEIAAKVEKGISWSEWYSKNSINLLLYVGAFLIVASASIFVGFQWETISGTMKASMLALVTLAFFGFGSFFYRVPKIRDAGNTFIAISAVLIPVCGTAWYNFVLAEKGIEPGIVWLTTSVIALGVYIYLAFSYKNKFYTYASSITALSLISSMVNTFNLDSNLYILAGIVTSFILMFLCFWSRKQEDIKDFTLIPLQISAQIMMPASLVLGFFVALGDDKLFSFEAVLSALLAAGFYVLSYLYFRKAYFTVISEILFSTAVVLLFYWQNFDKTILMYVLNFVAFAYLYKASILKKYNLKEETDLALAVGTAQSLLVVPFSFIPEVSAMHTAFLSLIPVIPGVAVSFIKNDIRYFGIATVALALAVPLFMADVFKIPNYFDYLGYGYLTAGLIFYGACIYLKNDLNSKKVFGLSTILFFALAFAFGLGTQTQRIIISLVLSVISVHAAWTFSLKEIIYISNLLIGFGLFNILRFYGVEGELYPFYYIGLACAIYAASFLPFPQDKNFLEVYRSSGLIAAFITPILGSFIGIDSIFSSKSLAERNSLITAYGVTALFGIDTVLRKRASFGYITSALGMVTFLWQIKYLGVSESLVYTIPLGLYFLALAYTRKIKGDANGRLLLDLFGVVFLIAPSAYSSLGSDSIKFLATLAASGIGLLFAGISLRYSLYKIAGVVAIVLAVLPQTYSYILALPRWLVVGIGGLLFIAVAIYLSLKRKETE